MACFPATLRVVLFVGHFLAGALNIAVCALPNWWWFNYAYWVQDTSGVIGTNGGIFQYCQHYRKWLQIDFGYHCYNYGDQNGEPGSLLDTTADLMPLGDAWRSTQACTVLALLLSFAVAFLIGCACKVVRKKLFMRLAALLSLLQCFLMIGAVGSAHQWIQTPLCFTCPWRDLYNYDFAFYLAASLIGIYMILFLIAFWTSCQDTDEPLRKQPPQPLMKKKKIGQPKMKYDPSDGGNVQTTKSELTPQDDIV